MEDAALKLEACRRWGKPTTITYGEGPLELVAHIESVTGGVVMLELLAGQGMTVIPIDDLHEIIHPPLQKVREGVFEVMRNQGPIC